MNSTADCTVDVSIIQEGAQDLNDNELRPMASPSDKTTARLTRVCTYKRWTQLAASEFGFFPDDVSELTETLNTESVETGYFQLRLAGLNRRTLRYRSNTGSYLIVTSVGQNQFLTRSSKIYRNTIIFAVAEEQRPGSVMPLFEWKLHGPCQMHFDHYLSCRNRYVLMCGPSDATDADEVPSARLVVRISADSFFSHKLTMRPKPDTSVWPINACFHPEQESVCAMVCSTARTRSLPRDKPCGHLAIYDVRSQKFLDSDLEGQVSSNLIQFTCKGSQVIVGDQPGSFSAYRRLLIFATDGLQLLHRIPVLPTCTLRNALLLYSPDFRRLAVVLSRKRPRLDAALSVNSSIYDMNGNCLSKEDHLAADQQVGVYQLKTRTEHLQLSFISAGVICSKVRQTQLHLLPLPRALIDDLYEHSCRM